MRYVRVGCIIKFIASEKCIKKLSEFIYCGQSEIHKCPWIKWEVLSWDTDDTRCYPRHAFQAGTFIKYLNSKHCPYWYQTECWVTSMWIFKCDGDNYYAVECVTLIPCYYIYWLAGFTVVLMADFPCQPVFPRPILPVGLIQSEWWHGLLWHSRLWILRQNHL